MDYRIGSAMEELLQNSRSGLESSRSSPGTRPSAGSPSHASHASHASLASALELDRKDETIRVLEDKVTELLVFKDKAAALERRMELVEAANTQREAAHTAKARELSARVRGFEDEEARIRGQLQFLEQARVRETDRHGAELARLRDELERVRGENARLRVPDPALTSRVSEMQVMLERSKEREDAHLRHTSKLQREIETLRKSVLEKEAALTDAQASRRASVAACESAKTSLAAAQAQITSLENSNTRLAAELGEAHSRLEASTRAAEDAQARAAVLPELEDQVQRIPVLEADVRAATARAQATDAQVANLESRLASALADARAAADKIADLERANTDLHARYVRPMSPSSELSQLKANYESLAATAAAADTARDAAEKRVEQTAAQVAALQQEQSAREDALSEALTHLQSLVEAKVAGRKADPVWGDELDRLARDDCLLGCVGPLLSGLHTRVNDIASAVDGFRAQTMTLTLKVDAATAELRGKEHELLTAHSEMEALMNRSEELCESLARAKGRVAELDSQLADLSAVSAAESADDAARLDALVGVAQRLDALDIVESAHPAPLASDGWAPLMAFFQDFPAVLDPQLHALSSRASAAETGLANARLDAESSAAVQLDKQAASLRAMHQAELAETRADLHAAKQAAIELQTQLLSSDAKAEAAMAVAGQSEERARRTQAIVQASLHALVLVVRAYRATRVTNMELVSQKRFLSNQARSLASVTASIHSLRMAMAGQLTAGDAGDATSLHGSSSLSMDGTKRKRHVSFRSAVIAVIAARRLTTLAASSEVRQRVLVDGRQVLLLADKAGQAASGSGRGRLPLDAFVEGLVPLSSATTANHNDDAAAAADASILGQVLDYFDATGVDEDLHFSPMLLASLASGQIGHAWWRSQIGAGPQGPVSDLDAAARGARWLDPVAPMRGIAVIRKTVLDVIQRLQGAESDARVLVNEFNVLETKAARAAQAEEAAQTAADHARRRLETVLLHQQELESKMSTMVDGDAHLDAINRVRQLEGAAAEAVARVAELEEELAKAKAKNQALLGRAKALDAKTKALTKSNADSQESNESAQAAIRGLEDKVEHMRGALKSLKSQLNEAQTLNTKVQAELVAAQTMSASQDQVTQRVSSELDAARSDVRRLEGELASANATASVNATQMLRLNTQLEDARAALEAAHARNAELEKQVAHESARITALEHSMVASQVHAVELQRESAARQARLESASRESAHYQQFRAQLAQHSTTAYPPPPPPLTASSSTVFQQPQQQLLQPQPQPPPPPPLAGATTATTTTGRGPFTWSSRDALRNQVADLDAQLEMVDALSPVRHMGGTPMTTPMGTTTPFASEAAQAMSESLSSALGLMGTYAPRQMER